MTYKLGYYFKPERFITVPYQIILFVISFSWILFFSLRILLQFHPVETSPKLELITPQVVQQWQQEPVYINTGLNILSFVTFDIIKNDFKANIYVWFEFDPKKVSFELIDKFLFVGASIIHRSPPVFQDMPNGMQLVKYHLWLQFSSELLYRRFPLDDHVLYLTLTNEAAKPSQIIYNVKPDNFRVHDKIQIGGWKVMHHDVSSGYISIPLSETLSLQVPRTVFSVGISKEDIRQLLLILLPLLFLFYIALFSLAVKKTESALDSSRASVAGVLAYSFVMQMLSPAVGYFMISDYIFILMLVCTFVVYLTHVLSSSRWVKEYASVQSMQRIQGCIVLGLYVLLLGTLFYFIQV